MSKYTDAMDDLNQTAYVAVRAALQQPGAPVDTLKAIAAQIDLLIDHGPALALLETQIDLSIDYGPALAMVEAHEQTDYEDGFDAGRKDAADRIELLEAKLAKAVEALNSIVRNTCCDTCQEAATVARAALAEVVGVLQ